MGSFKESRMTCRRRGHFLRLEQGQEAGAEWNERRCSVKDRGAEQGLETSVGLALAVKR